MISLRHVDDAPRLLTYAPHCVVASIVIISMTSEYGEALCSILVHLQIRSLQNLSYIHFFLPPRQHFDECAPAAYALLRIRLRIF